MKTGIRATNWLSLSISLYYCLLPAISAERTVVDNIEKPVDVVVAKPMNPPSTAEDVPSESEGDSELEYLNQEIEKQHEQINLNKQKTSKYRNLRKTTEKLGNVTEQYVEEKKASQEVINEYNLKIKCLLDEEETDPDCEEKNLDKIATSSASAAPIAAQGQQPLAVAPAPNTIPNTMPNTVMGQSPLIIQNIGQTSAAPNNDNIPLTAPVLSQEVLPSEAKSASQHIPLSSKVAQIGLSAGSATYNGTGVNNVRTNRWWGLELETAPSIDHHFTVGVGFQMHDFTTRDISPDYVSSFIDYYNNYYGYNGRIVEGKSYGLNLQGKFLMFNEGPFYPYLGLGVGYHLMDLKYQNNSRYAYSSYNFGGESSSQAYLSGVAKLGADYRLATSFALGVELFFQRGLSNTNGQQTNDPAFPDLLRLNQLSNAISESNLMGLTGGLKLLF